MIREGYKDIVQMVYFRGELPEKTALLLGKFGLKKIRQKD